MKKIFLQELPLMNTPIIVVCCNGKNEAEKLIQNSKFINKETKKNLKDINIENTLNGSIFYNIDTNQPLLLYMKDRKRDWSFYETLIHEINHVVFRLMKAISCDNETEFEARLNETLFREIRKKLVK